MVWNGLNVWNFCRSGSNKKLPNGKENMMFYSLADANEAVADFGFKIEGLVTSEKLETVSDGFGSVWSKICPNCGKSSMQVVRPGKIQCATCN